MAISYQILRDRRLVIVTTGGVVSPDETIQSFGRLFSDPEYSPEYDLLWDDTGRTSEVSFDDMREILSHFKRYTGDSNPKRAIVVSWADNYAMARVFDTMASISTRVRIGLFSNITEAYRWLGR